jgi:hypothetical protein
MAYRLESYRLLRNFNPLWHHDNDDLVSIGRVRTLVERLSNGRDKEPSIGPSLTQDSSAFPRWER